MAEEDHSDSAMIALVPTAEDAARLAVDGYEPADILHVTLVFLGDVSDLPDLTALEAGLRRVAASSPPIEMKTWATAEFNPTEKPCSVYLVGNAEDEHGEALESVHETVLEMAEVEVPSLPAQHIPFVPHLTIGYDLGTDALDQGGQPITFDRLRLAVGKDDIDIPFTGIAKTVDTGDLDTRLAALEAVAATPDGVSTALKDFADALHPRGSDGRFIVTDGYVHGQVTAEDGKVTEANRAKVLRILPNPSNADDPLIEVEMGNGLAAKALASELVTTAEIKARLDTPLAEEEISNTPEELAV